MGAVKESVVWQKPSGERANTPGVCLVGGAIQGSEGVDGKEVLSMIGVEKKL